MISVIIPLFNVERFIEECLRSLENQIYKNFEVLIINDGSTDNSVFIVEEYIKISSMCIKLVSQKNAGVSAARNKGIDEAIGEYLCFVDSDDMVTPEYLSGLIDLIKTNKSEAAFCGYKMVSENYKIDKHLESYNLSSHETISSYQALEKYLYHEFVSGACSLLVKKDLLEKYELRFTEGYRYSEDLEMVWKIISICKSISINKNQMYLYRTRRGSAMTFVDEKRDDGFKLMIGLEEHFRYYRPDFFMEFSKFGVARWVWATLWQIAITSENYSDFKVILNNIILKFI
ncbi:glycosyltransferase family 2 protein [Paenibacillus rhizoplanae]|uniref:glycosyltransferase family 2 protein n=1 Tax=Paenibacillus rhizoplanae TaxID=1917181 RepID=UPI00360BB0C3